MYRKDYLDGLVACRGVMIMVHRSVYSESISINSPFQVVAVQIRSSRLNHVLTICSLYIPPDHRVTQDELSTVIRQLPRPYVICGDFNAHSPVWGGVRTDHNGSQIETLLMDNQDICLLNSNEATHLNFSYGSISSIDLTLASSSLVLDVQWSIHDDLCHSDHYPILVEFINHNASQHSKREVWLFKKADWGTYKMNINFDTKINEITDIDKCLETVNDNMLKAAKVAIPILDTSKMKQLVPWWSEEVRNAIQDKKRALKNFRRNPIPVNFIEFKRCRSKARRVMLSEQRKSWSSFVSSIDKPLSITDMWAQIRRVKGRKPYNPIAALKNAQHQVTTNKREMCEILAHYYVQNSANTIYNEEFIRHKAAMEPILKSPSNTEMECYNVPFTYNELISTFAKCRSHAPGLDGVCYQLIIQLPQRALEKLLDIFNHIWINGLFPKVWKTALIVPVLKPKKNALIAENYRPISLLSCSNKIMEKMISKRLKWLVENKKMIDQYQSGNRRQRSTMDNLVILEHEVAVAFQNRELVIAVFLDIAKFFDRVSKVSVLEKLIQQNVGGPMYMYINNFLSEPQISVKIDGEKSSVYKLENSIRQGSSLSGDLCNIATSDISKFIPRDVSYGMFVDDLAIYMRGNDMEYIQHTLQTTLDNLTKWSNTNGLTFSPDKTFAVNFNRKRSMNNPRLSFQNHIVRFQEGTKWLGLNLDTRMTWRNHIEQTKTKSLRAMNVMKILSNRNWGLRRETLRKLYFALVSPILDYGSILYSSASQSNLNKLNVVHNSAIRLITGAFRTSPIVSILAESGIPPLSIRRSVLTLNYVCNVCRNPNNPVYTLLFHPSLGADISNPRYPKPLRTRVSEMDRYCELRPNSVAKLCTDDPPWLLRVPTVKYLTTTTKRNMINEEAIQHFREFRGQHTSHRFCFTDGSKTEHHTGAAFMLNNEIHKVRLNPMCSIFTAELTAIDMCLDELHQFLENNFCIQNFFICSDSKSSLQALQNLFHKSPLVNNITTKVQRISDMGTVVSFLWIPSHVGIRENNLVDEAAKNSNDAPLSTICTADDYRAVFKKVQLEVWAKSSRENQLTGQKLKKIKCDTRKWKSSTRDVRAEEIVVCRLRIGHCLATHQYLLERQNPPACHLCNQVPITIKHWLLECPRLNALRRKFKFGSCLKTILKDDEIIIDSCINFLKEADIFHRI
ncbi:hypothetical protein M8J77_007077 [Diaphorina citri]|nr:hypothetical protein M8J77_007077 [Diaphorina citri]